MRADLAFVGGRVLVGADDGVDGPTGADALAVRDGRIVALGADDVRPLIGAGTDVVDLGGGLLIPGFQDAHVHPVQGGLELNACDLSGAFTLAEYLDRIDRYARSRPEVAWITGGGWAMEAFPGGLPTREPLDSVVPDRPVYLPNRDHHGAWVNSRALELAGITEDTPDPRDGRIERDERGRPTGMLQEGAAELVARHVPRPTAADLRQALLRAQARLHAYGITAWQDALVGTGLGQADVLDTYLAAAAAGELTARVRGAQWFRKSRDLSQLDDLRHRRARASVGRFRADAVKIMLDGVAENHTASMLEPYLDGCGSPACDHSDPAHVLATSGLSFVDPEALRLYVTALDRDGFQVHFHAIGDRAVRDALDAIEAARTANGPAGPRHHIAHLQVIHPDDVPRFRALGAGANMQALWAAHEPQLDELTIPFLGPRRAAWQYPFGELHRSGATLVAGSDWPVTSADPIAGIHVAVNRTQPGSGAEAFLPDQRLDATTALRAYTRGSAWVNGLPETGVIRLGALADLAVLDRDLLAGPPDEIAATTVTQTFVEGVRVYAGAGAG
jgi:predicted amidohydrolase YtcJ